MRFADPIYLLFLLIIPLLVFYYFKRFKKPTIKYPELESIKLSFNQQKTKIKEWLPVILRLVVLSFIIFALARPQSGQKGEEILTKGVDIILCLDTSTSMRAEDFKPNNRFYVAKKSAEEFVKGRKHDRIGVVVFSALAFTQCPLTLDYGALIDFLDKTEIGMTQTDGTAIGSAIVTSLNRLRESNAKSKIIILLTDGRNNTGEIDPITAAKTASAIDVKIYTIGAGVPGGALYPVDDPIFGRRYVKIQDDLDEATLSEIAHITEGAYFRATSPEGLKNIFKQIDKMEKTEIKSKEFTEYTELYLYFLFPALLLFLAELFLKNTVLRRIP
ncbi:MAG TPA: aerotolerance regulator BatA [Elusimicrobia bacterium]|nr:MAG: aerotolerance regulator BatA [Elusimicrobia bacterium RIFOXYD2_FULL_34_30]HAM38946.1 aerotolerance regulator BatA [Elusimicrobiota bacterium]